MPVMWHIQTRIAWTEWRTMDCVILSLQMIHQLSSKCGQKTTAFEPHLEMPLKLFISNWIYGMQPTWPLSCIPNENDNMSVLKWYNRSRCLCSTWMLPSLKVLMVMWRVQQIILSFILHRLTVYSIIPDTLNQPRESMFLHILRIKVCTLAACETLHNRETTCPWGNCGSRNVTQGYQVFRSQYSGGSYCRAGIQHAAAK